MAVDPRVQERADAQEAISTVIITDKDGRIVSVGGVEPQEDIVLGIADGSEFKE